MIYFDDETLIDVYKLAEECDETTDFQELLLQEIISRGLDQKLSIK